MAVRKEEVRVTADVSNFVTKMASAGAAARGFADRLDEADGRMSNLVQAGLALAPAMVPLGAAAIPAIAGLANQLGIAAAAAGVAVLAFQGVGTAIKAIDAYKAAPTAANFAKLEESMRTLGPAAQDFALFISRLEPKLRAVRAVAAQGLLPGVEDGIRQLLPLLPEVNRVVFSLSSTLGDLVSKGARNLHSSEWTSFFTFLEADAATTLQALGGTVGNLASGFRDLWVAFGPLEAGFSTGLEGMSKSFADWAAGLAQTQGFQNFLAYISKSGPQALDALGAIATALLQIVEAAAPVGSVALPAITALANAISSLADSSVGPTLITVAAAVGVLGRSLSLLKTVGLRGGSNGFIQSNYVTPFKSLPGVLREASAATKAFSAAEREAQVAHGRYIGSLKASSTQLELLGMPGKNAGTNADALVAANNKQAAAAKRVADAERTKSAAIREGAASFGKGAAAAAGLAVATTGIADGMGLSNTASLAMMGTLAGPWGAAVGGGVGLVKDFASANNELESAVNASGAALSGQTVDFANSSALLARGQDEARKYGQAVHDAFDFTKIGSLSGSIKGLGDLFTHSSSESTASLRKQSDALLQLKQGAGEVYSSLNKGSIKMFYASDRAVTGFVNHITPALSKAGIDVKTFLSSASGSNVRLDGLKAIRSYFESFDSATGKSKAVGDALKGLGSNMDSDAAKADALKTALDNLFGVELSQSAATDAWAQSLADLGKQLKGSKDQLTGQSQAARDNRTAVRTSVSALKDKVDADAAAGVSGDKLADSLVRGRDAIIRQATAAGVHKKDIKAYLATLGLAPKNLATIIQTPGLLKAKDQIKALGRLYGLTPKEIRTLMSQPNMANAKAQITELARKYHLTPKQIATLVKLIDHASPALHTISGLMGGLRSKTVTFTTIHRDIRVGGKSGVAANPTLNADGALYVGRSRQFDDGGFTDSGAYVPRVSQMRQGGGNILWSEPETGWEAYISGKPGMQARNMEIWRQAGTRLGARFVELANGGMRYAQKASTGGGSGVATTLNIDGMAIQGTLQIPGLGEGYIRGIARSEAAGVQQQARSRADMNARAGAGRRGA